MSILKKLFKKIRAKIRHLLIGHLKIDHLRLEMELENIKMAIGAHEARMIKNSTIKSIQDAEFKVFSQFGEDGIIQYLVNKIPITNKVFIELGVGDYSESNTRFLLMNNNWQGRIVNSGTEHIEFIKNKKLGDFYYRYNIKAISSFIHKENIQNIIEKLNLPKDIGLLSIDLDGIDYWIWNEIKSISPRIVIIEYNSHFGSNFAITIPYEKNFDRTTAHHSNLYFGSSLFALCLLAKKKGYQFVGSNSAGINAFFVRDDIVGDLPKLSAKKGYVESMYRDSIDRSGNFTYISDHKERLRIIANQKVVDVEHKEKIITISKLFELQ